MTQLFYTYDTADTRQRDRMEKLLQSLKDRGVIAGWGSHSVGRGTKWRGEVSSQAKSADLTLLLLSNDFLSSGYLRTSEMSLALERHQQGETRIIPVMLRPCDLKGTPLAMLPTLPRGGKPVSRWNNADEAFDAIAAGIAGVVALRNGAAVAASSAANTSDTESSDAVDTTANVTHAAEPAAVASRSATPALAAVASVGTASSGSVASAAASTSPATATLRQEGAPTTPSLEQELPPIQIALAPKEIGAEYEALESPKDRDATSNGKARPWYTSVARANKRRVAQTVYRLESPSDASKRLEAAVRAEVAKGGQVETLADITEGVARRIRTAGQPASSVSVSVIAAKGRFLVGAKVMEAGDAESRPGQDPVALADSVVRRMLARIPA